MCVFQKLFISTKRTNPYSSDTMETDIELPADYDYKNYNIMIYTDIGFFLGNGDILDNTRRENPYKNKLNRGDKHSNGIISTLYTNHHIHTWRYHDNGTIYLYEQSNHLGQSHGLFLMFYKNGQLTCYRPSKYGKNDKLRINWDQDGYVLERKEYVNGVEVWSKLQNIINQLQNDINQIF